MNKLEKIEQNYKFGYPKLYKQLFEAEMLDWGKFGKDWYATYFEKMKQNPPLLFWANDFELIDFSELTEEVTALIEALKDPDDYRNAKPEFQFVPFAQTGGGDLYVFQFDEQNGEDVPITLLPHDMEEATILAKNLQDFIFRMLLKAVVEIDEYSRIAENDFEFNRVNILRTHKLYLTEKQFEILSEIYKRELFNYTYKVPNGREYTAKGLVSRDELEKILQQEIGFEKLNYEFVYMG